jgi:hypothetical protein
MNTKVTVFLLCSIITIVASAEQADQTRAGDGASKSTVYVYRHKEVGSRNMHPSVYVDGIDVAQMDDGKFFIIKLEPGKHIVEVNKGHSGAEIDMKAGEEYYFRVSIKAGVWKGHGQIDFIQKEQGAFEIKKMQPLESKWIKDTSRATAEEDKKHR